MTTPTRQPIQARRIVPTLVPNRSLVLMRPFYPSNDDIALRIVERVIVLSDEEVTELLDRVLGEFEDRHEGVEQFFRNRFEQVRHYLGEECSTSRKVEQMPEISPKTGMRALRPASLFSGFSKLFVIYSL